MNKDEASVVNRLTDRGKPGYALAAIVVMRMTRVRSGIGLATIVGLLAGWHW